MRSSRRLALVTVVPLAVLGLGAATPALAKPSPETNHGQCVSSSPAPQGKGGRSAVAKDKDACRPPAPLTCVENDDPSDGVDNVQRDSTTNSVTISGSGPGSAGSALQCETNIVVQAGDTISVDYVFGPGTAPCGGGVPRLYVLIGGTYYNTFDDNPNTCEAASSSLVLPVGGTVTEVGYVYDRGDTGSVTYSNATVGGVVLDI